MTTDTGTMTNTTKVYAVEMKTPKAVAVWEPLPPKLVGGWKASLRSDHTRTGYVSDVRGFTRWMAAQRSDDHPDGFSPLEATRGMIDLWARTLEKINKPATVVRKIAAVSSFLQYAADEGLIPDNPAARVNRPTVHMDDQQITPARTADELAALITAATTPRDRCLVLVLGLMGLRISEALSLDLDGLELDQGHQTVIVHGKGNRRSRAAVPPVVVEAFGRIARDEGRDTGPVFARDGQRWNRNQATRALRRIGRAAGIEGDLRPHQLRATAITLALETEPLHRVQTFARHASPMTTRRYDANREALDGSPTYSLAARFAHVL